MSTFTYLIFHSLTTYDTSKSYASRLEILDKGDLVAAGERIGLKLSMSKTKGELVEKLSSYVLSHPKEMVAMMNDEEVVLVHAIIKAGKNAITWQPHRLKYDTLKQMVWVLVNYNKQTRKDGFVMLDELQTTFASHIEARYEECQKAVLAAKKKKSTSPRLYLKDLRKQLDTLDIERLKIVHYLFCEHYLEHLDYYSGLEEGYHDHFYDWYKDGCIEHPYLLNLITFEILNKWKEHNPSKYRTAMTNLKDWMTYEFTHFDSSYISDVQTAFNKALLLNDEKKVAEALFPFATEIKRLSAEKKHLEAISLLFVLLDAIGEASLQHEDWFDSYWNGGTLTRVVILLETLHHFFCHLRNLPSLPFRIKEDMDIHLLITNKHHRLFGDLEIYTGDSRIDDLLSDPQYQYNDYSSIENGLYDYLEEQINKEKQL